MFRLHPILNRRPNAFGALCGVLALAACTNTSEDSNLEGVPYPTCGSAMEQCLDQMPVGDLSMPFYRNMSLTTPNPAVTEAIIVVHGSNRLANDFFNTLATAADQAGRSSTVLIVAPHFQCSEDRPPKGDVIWACRGQDWSHGYANTNGSGPAIYSYAVMDQFVTLIATKATFPNLTRIVITGMGSGGQLAQRYAATTQIDPVAGVTLEYVSVGPSTYLYLDANRPASGATCATSGGCQFSPPSNVGACSEYDSYAYGLENRSGYVGIPTTAEIQAEYVQRDVTYVVGDADTLANSAGTDLDTSCEANTEGVDRISRAIGFWNEVSSVYQAKHPLVIVPGCMHSRSCLYFSPEVRSLLFP